MASAEDTADVTLPTSPTQSLAPAETARGAVDEATASGENPPQPPVSHCTLTPANPDTEDRRRMKRDRDAAYGPTTPKGEEEEEGPKITGLTPLAKKGRVQPDAASSKSGLQNDSTSDTDSVEPADDELEDKTPPPAPSRTLAVSPPPTPLQIGGTGIIPLKVEGKETRHIRQRVEALEWEDEGKLQPGEGHAHGQADDQVVVDKDLDTIIRDVEQNGEAFHAESTTKDVVLHDVESHDAKTTSDDVELVDAASEPIEIDSQSQSQSHKEGLERRMDVVEQELEPEAILGEEAKDKEGEKDIVFSESKAVAFHAGEKSSFAEEAELGTESVVEEAGAPQKQEEVSTTEPPSKADEGGAGPTTSPLPPTPTPAPVKNSFSSYSSTASPFAAFSSTASPLASVLAGSPTVSASTPKPKTSSIFAAPSLPMSSPASTSKVPTPGLSSSTPVPKAIPSTFPTFSSTASAQAPTTPFGKSTATVSSSLASASPFSAFASSSGFGSAAKPVASGSAFGSYSTVAKDSPFANIQSQKQTEQSGEDESRKVGDPVEEDASKRVFTAQEVITGEEEDETVHSVRCKIYIMLEGAWVERGVGVIKLNVTRAEERSGARLVMRADATHRLLLNATLFSKFSIEVFQEKYVRFAIIESAEPTSYMLRMAGAPSAQAFTKAVTDRVALL